MRMDYDSKYKTVRCITMASKSIEEAIDCENFSYPLITAYVFMDDAWQKISDYRNKFRVVTSGINEHVIIDFKKMEAVDLSTGSTTLSFPQIITITGTARNEDGGVSEDFNYGWNVIVNGESYSSGLFVSGIACFDVEISGNSSIRINPNIYEANDTFESSVIRISLQQ